MASQTLDQIFAASPFTTWTGGQLLYLVNSSADAAAQASSIKTYINTSAQLVTPALGVPTSGALTNTTGLLATGVVGTAAVLTTANIFTVNGTASAPSITINGTWYSGGSATTTKPMVLVEPSGATSAGWSTSGTGLGINAASGFSGNLIDAQLDGATKFNVNRLGDVAAFSFSSSGNASGAGGINVSQSGVPGVVLQSAGVPTASNAGIFIHSTAGLSWTSSNAVGNSDTFLSRGGAAATLRHGAEDAASPVNQIVITQGSRAGTDSNVAGASLTVRSGLGTGTGTPSNLIINGIVGTTTGTGAQSSSVAVTVAGAATGQVPSVVIGAAAISTSATDGFLYIPTCVGAPTGTPTTQTGRIPMVYDTTNHQFWFYDSGWKQPKTPAGAAVVTWQ